MEFRNYIGALSARSKLNFRLGWTLLALVVVLSYARCSFTAFPQSYPLHQSVEEVEWWKKTNLYHIYVRSFRDSDGNGQGDLRGIVEKLDYLKEIGVDTLLLSPFYSSPMADAGYDIDDYYKVNERYGTLNDFDDLVSGLRERNMHIIVDFVPNHSSIKHMWFNCSEYALLDPVNCGKYKDYYVWSESTRFEGKYPTNWVSVFGGGPAWTWSPIRQAFYLHQFLPEQPDLNMRNPLVLDEFKNIVRFWLRRGADGLRVDASSFQFENTYDWPDEPLNPKWKEGEDPYLRLEHTATRALPESSSILKEWRDIAAKEFEGDRVIIIEAYDALPDLIADYGPNPGMRYCDMPFNFDLMALQHMYDTVKPAYMRKLLSTWLSATVRLQWPSERGGAHSPWSCWVTGNHDNKRIVNRLGRGALDWYKWLAYLAPGVPVNYYGDEIGLRDVDYNSIPNTTIAEGEPTRLVFRAPMAWNSEEPSAGFSSSEHIWMPLNPDFKTNNVEMLKKAEGKNALKNFMQLQRIRQDYLSIFVFGDLVMFPNHPNSTSSIFSMARTHPKYGNLLMVANVNPEDRETVRLRTTYKSVMRHEPDVSPPSTGRVLLSNFETEHMFEGKDIYLEGLELDPNQALLILY